jgi:hypothetical protein
MSEKKPYAPPKVVRLPADDPRARRLLEELAKLDELEPPRHPPG